MISGSRPGGRPLNLQGIWANSLKAKWEGDYHMNINLQVRSKPASTNVSVDTSTTRQQLLCWPSPEPEGWMVRVLHLRIKFDLAVAFGGVNAAGLSSVAVEMLSFSSIDEH